MSPYRTYGHCLSLGDAFSSSSLCSLPFTNTHTHVRDLFLMFQNGDLWLLKLYSTFWQISNAVELLLKILFHQTSTISFYFPRENSSWEIKTICLTKRITPWLFPITSSNWLHHNLSGEALGPPEITLSVGNFSPIKPGIRPNLPAGKLFDKWP